MNWCYTWLQNPTGGCVYNPVLTSSPILVHPLSRSKKGMGKNQIQKGAVGHRVKPLKVIKNKIKNRHIHQILSISTTDVFEIGISHFYLPMLADAFGSFKIYSMSSSSCVTSPCIYQQRKKQVWRKGVPYTSHLWTARWK